MLLVDNSVWQRASKPGVLRALERLGPTTSIVTTTPQILEFCHSARSPREFDQFVLRIAAFTRLLLDDECHDIAVQIQSALWHGGKVREVGAVDILVAAIGHRHGATVVHYDKNFATIGSVLDGFRQRWIAPAGSLD